MSRKHRKAGDEALEKMRKADAEAEWQGTFRCCGKPIKGTPAEISKLTAQHMKEGCNGASDRRDT